MPLEFGYHVFDIELLAGQLNDAMANPELAPILLKNIQDAVNKEAAFQASEGKMTSWEISLLEERNTKAKLPRLYYSYMSEMTMQVMMIAASKLSYWRS
jgi:hypothetical protein